MPVFDQGYQHWQGKIAGHGWRWLAIARHGMRTQLKGRYVRLLMIMAWMPALTLVGMLAVWGLIEQGALGSQGAFEYLAGLTKASDKHALRQAIWTVSFSFFFLTEIYFIMLIVTLAGPNLISRDLRNNALPLYLSRPITRLDYFLGKLGVIGGIVGMVAVLPAVVAYILGVCFSLDASVIRDTWRILPGSIIYGMVIVVSAGTLMLALSSLSRRSLYVGLAWFGIFLISWIVGFVLEVIMEVDVNNRIWQEQAQAQAVQAEELNSLRRENWGDFDDDGSPRARRAPSPAKPTPDEKEHELLARAERTNWRLLFSYPRDIQRVGEAALNTYDAWVTIGRAINAAKRNAQGMLAGSYGTAPSEESSGDREWADNLVMQHPWKWSAGVLAAIVGISLCILSLRVKSLDRLR